MKHPAKILTAPTAPAVKRQGRASDKPKPSALSDLVFAALTTSALTRLRPDSPWRPVDWRFRLATAERGPWPKGRRRSQDGLVVQCRSYLTDCERCSSEDDRLHLADLWPDVVTAHEIYLGGQSVSKHWLDARLLTPAPLRRVAELTGFSLGAVRWYEALFFNVRDRLDNKRWVYEMAIGPAVYGHGKLDVGTLWRLIAYAYGEVALDGFLNVLPGAGTPLQRADDAQAHFTAAARGILSRQGFLAMLRLGPGNDAQKLRLCRLNLAQQRLEQQRAQALANQRLAEERLALLARRQAEQVKAAEGGGRASAERPVAAHESRDVLAQLRAEEALAARRRAAASPLAQLAWADADEVVSPSEEHPTDSLWQIADACVADAAEKLIAA